MLNQRNVLVIARSDADNLTYQQQLQQDVTVDYNVLVGRSATSLLAFAQSTSKLDGILLELGSPHNRSLQLLRQLKEQTSAPVVVIDGGDTEVAVQAFKHGAIDYLIKDRATPDDLRLAMRSAIENAELKQELQRSQETFRTSVENMLDCFGMFSAMRDDSGEIVDFRIDYLNAAACENNQMPESMQIGRGLCEILPAHRELGLFDEYCRVVDTGEPLIKDALVYDDTFGDRRLRRAFDIRATKLNDGFVASWRDVTDRKRLELALNQTITDLRASQQHNRDLAEAMPQMVWTADSTGVITYWNQSWYDYTGLSEAESLELARTSTVHPEDRDRLLAQWNAAVTHRQALETEYRIQNQAGDYRWFICRATPTRDRPDQITGWIGTITDIDHQKQAALALQQSQTRLEMAMRAAHMGSWDWNIQTGEVNWSTNLEHLFGMAPGSFDGRYETVRAMIHPEDLPQFEQAIQRALYHHEEFNIEFRFFRPDGSIRWALSQGKALYDPSGQPIWMAGIDVDITERKQIEEALKASEARFRQLAENIDAVFWLKEVSENRFSYVSAAFERLWGLPSSTVLEAPCVWLDYIHPDDRAAVVQSLQAGAMAELGHQEYRIILPDHTVRWVRSRWFPLYDGTGAIYRLAGISEDITEQKQTHETLLENGRLLQLALAGAKAGSWDWNLQTNDVTWSPENYDLYGISTANATNWYRLWYNTIHPDDRERVRLELLQAIKQRQVELQIEFRIVHPQRGLRWLLGLGRFTLNQQGEPMRLSGINLDITDRKQTEEDLRQSEEFKNRLLESSLDCIKVLDIEGRLLYMNTGGMCIMEIDDLRPYLHQEWICFWGEEFRHLAEQALAAAKAGEVSIFRGFCPTAKGTDKWWEVIVSPIRGASGKPEQVLSVSRDITARREAELRLQESKKRLQLGMQVSGFALAQIDYSTNTVTLTPEAAALYDLPPDHLTLSRDQLHATFHPEDRPQLEQHIQAVLDPEGEGWFSQDHRILRSNGAVRWLSVRKQVFFDRSSSPPKPSHAILVALDITDRKQAEVERAHLLQQEQAARAEAERANRIKDEFLAVLSHELRSPLNPILGWTKLLQLRKFDAAKTAEALAIIERNANLQTQLIDDLLDVAKILRGKLVIELATVDLAVVIESAIETVRAAAVAKSIQLHSALPQIGCISGDSARLQQVVWNVLSNAIKFTPQQGRVDILLERVGNQAQIKVSDTGKGINPTFLPHLFESFQQEDASITRKYGGLGLGLAIVRSLVEAHGGTITADSPGEDQGATFTIHFPLIAIEPEVEQSEPRLAQDLDLTGVRVLAVDDEPDARELLTVVLTMYGADVLTVTSAAEVLTALTSFQPDVLVSDIGMPYDDGYSLIQQIRGLPPEQGGQIPAIALTAYARDEDYKRAIASGFQQQVTKPLNPEQLVQVVGTLARGL
ncbi:PAS domain-containing protein [Nodosilinea sp. E11]|uniref:PAS domain-containing protein n=1 Tax=Nodosilinea sp. E11 TaxID=3037479 RepID=UPI0029347155|nr:PAS domain-containing protein [Nodosilinea sp. E11]WOD39787.1 PAS domain-containing protein [Nodosilinea sp. E11]